MKRALAFAFSIVTSVFASAGTQPGFLETWVPGPALRADASFRAIYQGSAPLVAVGDRGKIATSIDGRTWTLRNSGTSLDLYDVTYGAGHYVAVGAGIIATSVDGAKWTLHDTDLYFTSIIHALDRFVASAGGRVHVSDDGLEWTGTDAWGPDRQDVTYGDGRFVAVSRQRIHFSSDGHSWSIAPFADFDSSDWLRTVTYGNGYFVAVGQAGSWSLVMTSQDGQSWLRSTMISSPFNSVHYHKYAGRFYASADDGRLASAASTVSAPTFWLFQNAPGQISGFASSGAQVFAVGEHSSIWWNESLSQGWPPPANQWSALVSGQSWTDRTIHGFAEGDGRAVLVGRNGLVKVSKQGGPWARRDLDVAQSFRDVVYHNGLFVAVGGHGSPAMTSGDGFEWTARELPVEQSLQAVASGDGVLVAVGAGGTIVVSADGVLWQEVVSGVTAGLNGVAFGNGAYVAVGWNGTILVSEEGNEWETIASGVTTGLQSVVFGDGKFVAAGDAGAILTSIDGRNWEIRDSGVWWALHDVAYAHGHYVAVGGRQVESDAHEALLLVSKDGIHWEERATDLPSRLHAAGFVRGQFIAGGTFGGLLRSNVVKIDPPESRVTAAGESFFLSIIGAREWTASSGADWISIDLTEGGTDESIITVTVQQNMDIQDRDATIEIAGIAHLVRQDGAGLTVSVTASAGGHVEVEPDPAGARVAPGTMLQLSAEPAETFLGWTGIDEATSSVEIVLESDLSAMAHFQTGEDHFMDMAEIGGRTVAVGRDGRIYSAPAGEPWFVYESGDHQRQWRSVATGNNRAVAVSRDGAAAMSEDGLLWQEIWGLKLPRIWRIAFFDGSFWAVGDRGALLRSADGLGWTAIPLPVEDHLHGIAYTGDLWVVVGDRGTILTSTDGQQWEPQDAGTAARLRDIAYGSGGFVAVGHAGIILHSPDAVTWTTFEVDTPVVSAVAHGNGRYVVMAGLGSHLQSFVSDDGLGWTGTEVPHFTHFRNLYFADNRFIAAGENGMILSSENGEEWEIVRTGSDPGLWGIAEGENDLVAVGETGRLQSRGTGGNWSISHTRSSAWLWDVASAEGATIAVGDHGVILRRAPGSADWERVRGPFRGDADAGAALHAVGHGEGRWIAVGRNGKCVVSADGISWDTHTLPTTRTLLGLTFGDGVFVAAGKGGTVLTASVELDWRVVDLGTHAPIHGVTFQEGTGFTIAGNEGFIAHSPDGENWKILPALDDESWEGLTSGTGWIVTVGATGAVALSSDGRHWDWLGEGAGRPLHAVAAGDWGATAVGAAGAIEDFLLPPLARWVGGDVEASRSDAVMLASHPGGTPPFSYIWTRDGEVIHSGSEPVLWLIGIERSDIGDYRVEVINDAGKATSAPLFVSVLTSFTEWREERFADPTDEQAAPVADPKGTGVPNLVVYALDLDPLSPRGDLPAAGIESHPFNDPAAAPVPQGAIQTLGEAGEEADYLTLTFSRAIGANDVAIVPLASGDLVNWEPLPEENFIRIIRQGDRELVTVRDNVSLDQTEGKRFLQLRVSFVD